MKKAYLKLLSVAIFIAAISSCQKDDASETPGTSEVSKLTRMVNEFSIESLSDAYLWNNKLPDNIDPRKEADPIALFDRMTYKPDDRWSFLSDEGDKLTEELDGVETSFGYSVKFYLLADNSVIGIVEYVHPNSPAAKAGIIRGDIIAKIDNQTITESNYMSLYESSSLNIQTAYIKDQRITLTGKSYNITANKEYLNPIIENKIIEKAGKKIGYLCYSGYNAESESMLADVFIKFKSSGVEDVVLDLRYNPGGLASTAIFLSSVLAPASAVNTRSIYLKYIWNDDYMRAFKQEGYSEGFTENYFNNKVPVNMDLKRLFVLTSRGTASASEATMVGLSAYLDVIQIGDTTHGKYTGAMLLRPDKNKSEIKNWGAYVVVYRFANKNGITDFKNGFVPKYLIKENLMANTSEIKQLGDPEEQLFTKAIEIITGIPAKATYSTQKTKSIKATEIPDTRRKILDLGMIEKEKLPIW